MDDPSSPSPPPRPSTRPSTLPRRSVTLPIQQTLATFRDRRVSFSGPPDPQVETLYSHSSVRIVAFTASSATNGKPTGEVEEVGTLPWSSRLERTIAIGQMRIYRPPGSVAFLTCGTVIKPILPKSQCWCVDEEASKFVLLIKRPQYWRIELSMIGSGAKEELEKFKDILLAILYFEKTICPFARGFTVELPEPPKGPIIKKPWRPVAKPKDEMVSVVEVLPSEVESEYYSATSGNPSENSSIFGDDSDATDDTNATPKYSNYPQRLLMEDDQEAATDSTPSRSRKHPQLTVMTSHTSKQSPPRPRSPLGKINNSLSSSTDSFHTTQSWHPMSAPKSNPSSPVEPSFNETPSRPKRQDRSHNVTPSRKTPDTPGSWSSPCDTHPSSFPQTPGLVYPSDDDTKSVSSESEISTPPRAPRSRSPKSLTPDSKIHHRATTSSNSRRRTISPLPSPATMFSPERRRQKQLQLSPPPQQNLQARKLPAMMIRKTCEILMSPPGHLINIMLGMAAKIAAGEWKGGWMIWGVGDENLAYEVDADEEEGELDDYGFEIRRKPSSSNLKMRAKAGLRVREVENVRMGNMPGSWEID